MFLPQFGKKNNKRWWARHFEKRLLLSIVYAGLPGSVLCLVLLWTNAYSLDHKIEGTIFVMVTWIGLSFSARDGVVYSLHVLSNVISSLRNEDFSFRASKAVLGDALGDLAIEINDLARALESERLGTMEAESLLRKVMVETDAVILAFAPDNRVQLFNRAAALFLGCEQTEILGRTARELEIEDILESRASDTISRSSNGVEKRWIVRRTSFRQKGVPHRLLMLSEASEALRAEERLAWRRLVRVLSHEINNSLAPIKSIARTLTRVSTHPQIPESVRNDFKLGLEVIGNRTEGLNRFLQGYARLTKLPPPLRQAVPLRNLVERVAGLESRLPIQIVPGPEIFITVDPDQMEQALINLSRNAVEAVLMNDNAGHSAPAVCISWAVKAKDVEIWIRDSGIGVLDSSNLFVPFYTTKEGGSGIGLLLSRQIIETHGGTLTIQNRKEAEGCEVGINLIGCLVSADKSGE